MEKIYCESKNKTVEVSGEVIDSSALEDEKKSLTKGRIECSDTFCDHDDCPLEKR